MKDAVSKGTVMPESGAERKPKGSEKVPSQGYYQRLKKKYGEMLDAMGSVD